MNFDGEYKLIGTIDPASLVAAVEALDEADWFEETGRQEAFPPHRKTQTIPLIYDPDMRHTSPTIWPRLARLEHALAPTMQAIVDHFQSRPPHGTPGGESPGDEQGYFVRAILVRLGAGESIGTHRDHGESLARAHRIHVAIKTNDKAEFGIAGHVRYLPPGEIWEINNRRPHAVRNLGDAARVHLILDYVVPGERVEDPDGTLVA